MTCRLGLIKVWMKWAKIQNLHKNVLGYIWTVFLEIRHSYCTYHITFWILNVSYSISRGLYSSIEYLSSWHIFKLYFSLSNFLILVCIWGSRVFPLTYARPNLFVSCTRTCSFCWGSVAHDPGVTRQQQLWPHQYCHWLTNMLFLQFFKHIFTKKGLQYSSLLQIINEKYNKQIAAFKKILTILIILLLQGVHKVHVVLSDHQLNLMCSSSINFFDILIDVYRTVCWRLF